MEKKLQLAYAKEDEDIASKVASSLKKKGFEVKLVQGEINPNEVVMVLMTERTKKESLLKSAPWIEEQFSYSSYPYLRAMPLVAYHPKKESIDSLWEKGVGELYESIFSEEFKPYGWDLDDEEGNQEFLRVLEEGYSE